MNNKKIVKYIEFIEDIIKVYERYELSLSHEDTHGGFIIEEINEENIEWIRDARVKRKR